MLLPLHWGLLEKWALLLFLIQLWIQVVKWRKPHRDLIILAWSYVRRYTHLVGVSTWGGTSILNAAEPWIKGGGLESIHLLIQRRYAVVLVRLSSIGVEFLFLLWSNMLLLLPLHFHKVLRGCFGHVTCYSLLILSASWISWPLSHVI